MPAADKRQAENEGMTVERSMLWVFVLVSLFVAADAFAQQQTERSGKQSRPKPVRDEDLSYPPRLPGDASIATDKSRLFLQQPESLRAGVTVADEPPTVDFLFYPHQTYPGKPWSNWGSGSVSGGKYYSAIGDHHAIGRAVAERAGNAMVYQYDPSRTALTMLGDTASTLKLPAGHYAPGKIHTRVDVGKDGCLYYGTHRGSSRAAIDKNHYRGDWILRTDPRTLRMEVVVHAPVPKHSIPNGMLDPERMIYYGGTAAGPDAASQEIHFFAYDLAEKKLLYSGPGGPARAMILARSTGRVYFVPGNDDGELLRWDSNLQQPPTPTGQRMGLRAATRETKDGFVYAVSKGQKATDAAVWKFNTSNETVKQIGTVSIGQEAYVASIDVDPSGRFLYYVPGAHGGGYRDGSPIVQYDVVRNRKKVIAFLHPFYEDKYGLTLKGTYSCALSEAGDKLFVTWNVSRGTRAWDCCALTVVHIPASER